MLTLTDSTVSGNSTGGFRGGGFVNVAGQATLTNSTISGNTSTGQGAGGLWNWIGGTLTLINCTVSGNTGNGYSGGILNDGSTLTLTNSTVSGNHDINGSSAFVAGGVGNTGGPVTIKNTLVANNTINAGNSPSDCAGAITSQGFNLIRNTTGATITPAQTTDIFGLDPLLGALANNGGPTQTMALLPGSPAIDKGSAANYPISGNPILTDQRGSLRPKDFTVIANPAGGNGSDIGAFEVQSLPLTITALGPLTRQQGSAATNSIIALASDSNPGTLTVTATTVPAGITVTNIANPVGEIFNANVAASCTAAIGTNTVVLTVTNGTTNATSTANLTVNVNANTSPALTYSNQTVLTGGSLNVSPTLVTDNGSITGFSVFSVTPALTTAPTVNASGVVAISNAAPVGAHTITIRATDNCGATTDATFTLTINNNPPTITAGAALTRQRGTASSVGTIATVSDDITAAGSITVAGTTVPAGITITGISNSGGTITATVAADCMAALGNNTVVLTATDGNSATATANFIVNVTANTPPTLGTYLAAGPINAGGGITVTPSGPAPSDNGTVSSITATASGFTGSFSGNPVTGAITITNAGPAGFFIVTVTATDNCGVTATTTFSLFVNCPGATITVTGNADGALGALAGNGTCDLREAITAANKNEVVGECPAGNAIGSGLDTIYFAIGPNTPTISVTGSALPTITQPIVIDGSACQSTRVELRGTGTTFVGSGLTVSAGNSTLRGLVINRFFNAQGIYLLTNGGNRIENCFVGTDAAGAVDQGNGIHGIAIDDSPNNIIGGTTVGARNVISGNDADGILIQGSSSTGNVIQGNFIGTNAAGTAAIGNFSGVRLISSPNNTIGGTTTGTRNVISGNTVHGVHIVNVTATGNQVLGNLIGTSAAGNADLGNVMNGVQIEDASGNTIGGTAVGAGNIVSGNNNHGVSILRGLTGNTVQGNFIGTNLAGTGALGNSVMGINIDQSPNNIIGGLTASVRNVVSANSYGIVLLEPASSGNLIQGNYIGTNANGTTDLGNINDGVNLFSAPNNLIGGDVAGAGNLISGNNNYGIWMQNASSHHNQVRGNLIGTNFSGTAALGNSNGIGLKNAPNNTIGGTTVSARNIVAEYSGGTSTGIAIIDADAKNNLIQGNYIGTDITGTIDLTTGPFTVGIAIADAPDNVIGGTVAGARNLISGSNFTNLQISSGSASGNLVQGNYIGTNASGTGLLVNLGDRPTGIYIVGAPNTTIGGTVNGAGNLISGNQSGVRVQNTSGATIQGNYIGTDISGAAALGNSVAGVLISSSTNVIGGNVSGARNVIAFNGSEGVFVSSGASNSIFSNSIFSNGLLGIDLSPKPVTANDAGDSDTGPNNLQNFPVLTQATATPNQIQGTLNSTANTAFTIQFFSNSACDGSGNGEGQTYLGQLTNVTTDGGGNAAFNFTPAAALTAGAFVTATATDPNGNTSEFSVCRSVTAAPPPTLSINDVTVTEGNSGMVNAVFTVTLTSASTSLVTVQYATANATATAGSDYTATSGTLTFPANTPTLTRTISVPVIGDTNIEPNETFFVNLNNSTVTIADGQGLGTITNDDCPSVTLLTTFGFGTLSRAEGVAVNTAGNIYVVDDIKNIVQKFEANGTPLFQWGGTHLSSDGKFFFPQGVAVAVTGNVYVADSGNNRIQKFDANGGHLFTWGSSGSSDGEFLFPEGVAVAGAGNVYVADSGNNRIQKFDANGGHLLTWGKQGTNNKEFNSPKDVAVDAASGSVYVVDRYNDRIQKFDANGNFLLKWGSNGSGDGQFFFPNGVAVDAASNVYVVDGNNHIQKFDANGNFLLKWSVDAKAVAVDATGNVYVIRSTYFNSDIQKFSVPPSPTANAGPDQLLTTLGGPIPVTLNGSGLSPFGLPLTYQWRKGTTVLGSVATLNVNLPAGTHTITLVVTDLCGFPGYDTVVIKIGKNTFPGNNVTAQIDPVTVAFANVIAAGALFVEAIEPSLAGASPNRPTQLKTAKATNALPSGYEVFENLAYEVSTTATVSGPITVCINVPTATNQAVFNSLRILHYESGALVDRTILAPDSPAPDFNTKTVCARTSTLGLFVVVRKLNNPPTMSAVTTSPAVLSPPHHNLIDVAVNYTTNATWSPATCSLNVVSSEPDPGLDADDVPNDIQVVNPHLVRLRAERSSTGLGLGLGRSYSITVNCIDTLDQTVSQTVAVNVTEYEPFANLPGTPLPTIDSTASDQKPGSVLFYPVYTSDATRPGAQNTRINLTNADTQRTAYVHLFFVDGPSCAVADSFICLTPNQTASFLASDLDPGTTGYVIAVATDRNGCPVVFNALIGDEFVKFASGHAANLGAEAVAGLAGLAINPPCATNESTAELRFDGISYNALPRVLAASNLPSRGDGNDTMLIVNRIGGNLGTGAATLGTLFGLLYDDAEKTYSFSLPAATCQSRGSLTNDRPRTVPRYETIIGSGRSGWLKLYGGTDIGIIGAQINRNSNATSNPGAFNQGHNLHKLTLTTTASVTIPVFPPTC